MSTGLLFGSKEQEARVKLPRNHHTEQHTHTQTLAVIPTVPAADGLTPTADTGLM